MMRPKLFLLWAACGVACVLGSSAHATTFVLMDEHELAAASTAVVTGWVTGVESHPDGLTGGVNTYITIEPTAVLAGSLPEGEIVLRERGGQIQGRNEKIFGAPEYTIGEEVVSFLSQDTDGSLHTTNMALGKYTVQAQSGGLTTVSRALGAEVMVLDRSTGRLEAQVAPDVSELAQFVEHVRTAAQRSRRPSSSRSVRLTPPELDVTVPHTYSSPFTYLGNPSRWFEPDFGQPVLYQIDATGDARNGPAASRSAMDSAFAAWTNVPNSSLVLGDGGLLSTPLPFSGCTGGSRLVFNDPFNEISDPSGCGGILAIGGYCSNGETTNVNGTTFQRIMLGKVVFNNGWEQCAVWTACNLAEVATHEIGHTIGLGHSTDGTATMAASAHFDGRCAGLQADDITAAQFIYPEGISVPTPTASPAPQPTATSTPPPPPPASPTNTPGSQTNDTCANAAVIDVIPYNNTVVTTSATLDSSDPIPACGNGSRGKSVWYRFTAPASGIVTANTFGSNYDTILAAYAGTCGAFAPVPGACNDDTNGRQSRVSFQATAGMTYYFMPVAYSNNGGTLVFQLTFQTATGTATPTRTSTPRPPTPIVDVSGPTATASATPIAATPTPTSRPPAPTFTNTPQFSAPGGLPNDSVTTPLDVVTTPFSTTLNTVSATLDSADPAPACGNRSRAKSVWFRFTAPSNGTLVANTFGSNYDTILAAYARSGDTLTPVGCNDDASSPQSRLSFQASAGAVYYFMAVAYSNNGGTLVFQLTFQGTGNTIPPTATFTPRAPTPTFTAAIAGTATYTPTSTGAGPNPPAPTATSPSSCPNDSCMNPMDVASTPFSYAMVTTSATLDPTDPAPSCGNGSRAKSVWFHFTAPSAGTLTADTFGSNYDTILAAFYKSGNVLSPVAGACNDDASGSQSRISFQAIAGGNYYLVVTAYSNNGGNLVFHLNFQGTGGAPAPTPTATAAQPPPTATFTPRAQGDAPPTNGSLANDVCTGATAIAATPYSVTTTTSSAAAELAMPAPTCGNRSAAKSVWYQFTAPTTATLAASTYGSNYDTILAAYAGSCDALTQVACNDDSVGSQSRLSVQAVAGTTYYFLVTAYRNDGGTLVFRLTN